MNYAVYLIDGLAEPPWSWASLAMELQKLGFEVYRYDRLSSRLIAQMRAELPDTRIIAVGHSLGGERIEMFAASGIKLYAAVLIDAVRGNWERRPFDVQAEHVISYTRRWLFGFPPSMGARDKDVKVNAGHNSIIAKVTPAVLEWIGGIV